MSNQIAVERFTQELFTILNETFEQVHGIYLDRNTSLFETLEGISAEEASRPISDRCATIAAQVKHVRFYLDVLQAYMLKKEVGKVDWQEIWRTTREVSPDEWESLKQQLRESYQSVLTMMRNFDSWESEENLSGSLAILAHTAYHLGEIRQALCVIK